MAADLFIRFQGTGGSVPETEVIVISVIAVGGVGGGEGGVFDGA